MAKRGFGVGVHPYTYYQGTGTTPPVPGRVRVPVASIEVVFHAPQVSGHSAVQVFPPTAETVVEALAPTVQARMGATVLLTTTLDTVEEVLLPEVRARTHRVLAPVLDTEMDLFAPAPFQDLAIPAFFYDGFQGHVVWATGTTNAIAGQQLMGFFCITRGADGQRHTIFRGRGTVPWEVAVRADDAVEFTANGGAMFSCVTPVGATQAQGLLVGIFRCSGATAELVVYRQNDIGNPLVGVNTPGTPTNIEFDDATYVGQDGAGAGFLRGQWHVGGWGFFSRPLSPETVEQFLDTSTGFPRFPGAGGSGYLDGEETWEVMLQGPTAATNGGAGGAPSGAGSMPEDTSPGSYAPDLVLTGFPIRPPQVDAVVDVLVPAAVQARRHGAQVPTHDTELVLQVPGLSPAPDPDLVAVQSFSNEAVTASPWAVGSYSAGSGVNRKFLFFESTEVDASGSGITGLTWGGVSAVQVERVDFAPALNIASIWEIDEANFPPGATGDIVATLSATGDANGSAMIGFAGTLRNAVQQPAEATAEGTTTANTLDTNITTLTDRALAVDVVSAGMSGTLSPTQGPGQVAAAATVSLPSGRFTAARLSSRFVATAGLTTLGWSHDGTANRLAHVLAAYRRAGSSAPPSALDFAFSDSEINTLNANQNAGSYTYTGVDIGAAADDRYVLAGFFAESSNTNLQTNVTVTPAGGTAINMTHIADIRINGGQIAVYIANVQTATTADFHIQWNNSRIHSGLIVYRAVGINPTPHDVVEVTGLDLSAVLDTPAGGVAVGFMCSPTNETPGLTWTGLVEDEASTMENSGWAASASADELAGGALNVNAAQAVQETGDCAIYISFAAA